MSHNTIGHLFRLTTFGESHGPMTGGVVDGCPPGVALSLPTIQSFMDRRRPGQSRFTTQRREPDQVRLVSGVMETEAGYITTGTPITIIIDNVDQRSKDYSKIADRYRPGHADYTYDAKYGLRDYRGGGRSSARETGMRVAAGAIAKKFLQQRLGVQVRGYLSQLGPCRINQGDWDDVENNPFFCPDAALVPQLEEYMAALNKTGDSIGARLTVVASQVPVGLGEPVFDRLDADIAHALMGINAVKGVAVGDGFDVVGQRGARRGLVPAAGVHE